MILEFRKRRRAHARGSHTSGGDVWKKSGQDRQDEPRKQDAKEMLSVHVRQGTSERKNAVNLLVEIVILERLNAREKSRFRVESNTSRTGPVVRPAAALPVNTGSIALFTSVSASQEDNSLAGRIPSLFVFRKPALHHSSRHRPAIRAQKKPGSDHDIKHS